MIRKVWVIRDRIRKGKSISKAEYKVLEGMVKEFQGEIDKNTITPDGDMEYAFDMMDEQTKILELMKKAKVE